MKVEITWAGRNKASFFKLKGTTIKSVFSELESRGEWGRFTGNMPFTYKGKSDSQISRVDLRPDSTITLPKWPAYSKQSPKVKENWDEMYRALKKHENGHAAIFENGLLRLQKELEELGEITASDLESRLQTANQEIQKSSDNYDTRTENGKRDGVILYLD